MVRQLKKSTYIKREKSAQAALTDAERRCQYVRPRIFPWYCCVRSIFCCYCNSGRVEDWLQPCLGILEGAGMLCIPIHTSLIASRFDRFFPRPCAEASVVCSPCMPSSGVFMCVGCFLLQRGSFSICTADGMSSSTMPPLYSFYTFYHLSQHGRCFQASMHECQVSMGIHMDYAHCCHSERHLWSDQ